MNITRRHCNQKVDHHEGHRPKGCLRTPYATFDPQRFIRYSPVDGIYKICTTADDDRSIQHRFPLLLNRSEKGSPKNRQRSPQQCRFGLIEVALGLEFEHLQLVDHQLSILQVN
ncbi:MAG: hypothetical protein M2R45_00706 [Verrucomicrobia subdivision 3 bacterium]|nr:hypothetical protein [Limisphaerales bacterium]